MTVGCWSWEKTALQPAPVAVGLSKGDLDLHIGLLYLAEATPRALHLAWHHKLRDDEVSKAAGWWVVDCVIDELFRKVLLGHCINLANKRRVAKIPYGLRNRCSTIDQDGVFRPGPGESGFTCATFVLALFELAGVVLLDRDSWESRDGARKAEDEFVQQALVEALRQTAPEQAAAAEREIGCARFRPEEVAAASGLPATPVPFPAAAAEGQLLRTHICAPRVRKRSKGKSTTK